MAVKLLWLTENYPPQRGGMAQSCDRIIHGLRKNNYEIEIIHFAVKGHHLVRKQQSGGGYTAVVYEESESHTLNLAWNYVKTLGNFDYVVAYGNNLSLTGAPIFAKWMKSKLITFLRGNDFDTSIFTPRKRETLQYALEQSAIVFSVSHEKLLKIKIWIPEGSVHHVPNGINLEEWRPSKSEISFAGKWTKENVKGKICLGLIGQLKPKKGVQFFIRALSKTSVKDQVHLLLIGEIEEIHKEQLDQKGLSYSLVSFQDRFQLMKYYLCCHALVIPSFYEGMPNVMLEAGALAIPIIASKVDGMADVIEHNVDGLLFQVGNEDACRRVLYEFISMKDSWAEMGQKLKMKIKNKYTAYHEMENYSNFII